MSEVLTTIISNELNKEIIKIKNGKYSIIIYSYNDQGVVINGTKNEPHIIACITRDIFIMIMKYKYHQQYIFDLCDGIDGKTLANNTEMYHISKVVLQTVINKEKGVCYTAKSVECNNLTNSYDLYCMYLRAPISIPSFAIHSLIEYEESKGFGVHIGYIDYRLNKCNDKIVITITNSNDNTANNIDVTKIYSDLKTSANHYLLKADIEDGDDIAITNMYIERDTLIIRFGPEYGKYQLHIKIDTAIDLFTSKVSIANAVIYSDKISVPCIIEYDKYSCNIITISAFNKEKINCSIEAYCDASQMFKQTLLMALKGEKEN